MGKRPDIMGGEKEGIGICGHEGVSVVIGSDTEPYRALIVLLMYRWIHNPNLGLVGALGNGFEPGQIHVPEVHITLPNLPLSTDERIDGVRALQFSVRQRWSAVSLQSQLTLIESKYFSSFLAMRWASLPRVIGSRFLFQRVVKIFHTVNVHYATGDKHSYLG